MKLRIPIQTLAYWLILVLALAAASVSFGRREFVSNPSIDSFGPSGAAAFAQLLRQEGFEVKISRSASPVLRPGELAIAYVIDDRLSGLGDPPQPGENSSNSYSGLIQKSLRQHLYEGGRVLLLPLDQDFTDTSLHARNALDNGRMPVPAVRSRDGAQLEVAYNPLQTEAALSLVGNRYVYDLWRIETEGKPRPSDGLVRISRVGQGYLGGVRDGLMATNRYIDRHDNATLLLDVVRTMAGPSRTVVFTEAAFGNVVEPSLMESIGAWALASWRQLLFLVLVVVFTLGKRFGLPARQRRTQRGARDLMDAIARTYARAKMNKAAIHSALEDADSKIRRSLHLPRDASRKERDALLPESLRSLIARLEAVGDKPDTRTSLQLVQQLEAELDAFLTSHKSPEPVSGAVA